MNSIYREPLALHTDLYELTMAFGYWKLGMDRLGAAFSLVFRKNPFGGSFAIACGLERAAGYVSGFRFEEDDIEYLAGVEGNDGSPMFSREFFDYLRKLKLECTIDAVPEGCAVFPHEPLAVVTGPLLHCQILETALLNIINFQTLIATKAARVCLAARGDPVVEFGLRRAHGIDGGLSASRAAYLGGCASTSNVLAGKIHGIPVRGTHAHSWVMAFENEIDSFLAYAEALPNNCIMLVDTYDTLQGVRNAVEAGRRLREKGFDLAGIRLDSGDLDSLSKESRKILDEAGFERAAILASGDLDEYAIEDLKKAGAPIDLWGVGTRLATGHGEGALNGIYKLTAVKADGARAGGWQPRIKLSEKLSKVTDPGIHQVRRFMKEEGRFLADAVYDRIMGIRLPCTVIDPADPARRMHIPDRAPGEDLLVRIFENGNRTWDPPPIRESRSLAVSQIASLGEEITRLSDPRPYMAGLEENLFNMKASMIERRQAGEGRAT